MSRVKRVSSLYESPAWPDPADPAFINAIAEIETSLPPEALLAGLHAIEAGFGRRRSVRNAPRSLDLDLIAYHNEIRGGEDADLILPHPRLSGRAFVLAPLLEVAPDWRHPVSGETAAEMAAQSDMSLMRKIS
jgi:2-amino-4-hydroxy-6-hydroxymethyldihydropteridine diphosphokinase